MILNESLFRCINGNQNHYFLNKNKIIWRHDINTVIQKKCKENLRGIKEQLSENKNYFQCTR